MLNRIVPQPDREGIKGRDDGQRGGGGIIRGRRLSPVKYFRQRGAIIRGNTVPKFRVDCISGHNCLIISFSIRHFRDEKETGAEMCPAIVSGIVTGVAPVSYWPIFFRFPSNSPRSLCKS